MIKLWNWLKQRKPRYRTAEPILNIISKSARVVVSKAEQSGYDERWILAFKKHGEQEAELLREFGVLLKSLEKWLATEGRSPATPAVLEKQFGDWLALARDRERALFKPGEISSQKVADIGGHVSDAVRLPPAPSAVGQVIGRNFEDNLQEYIRILKKQAGLESGALAAATDQARRILAVFQKAWERRRPIEEIQKIMNDFVVNPKTKKQLQEIRKLRADAKVAAETDKKVLLEKAERLTTKIKDRLRGRFASARTAWLRELFDDPQLPKELKSIAVVLEKRKTGRTFSLELNLGSPQLPAKGPIGAAVTATETELKITLNVDHDEIDFANAVESWITTGKTDALYPVIAGPNMRLATGLENQVLFNFLKKDAQQWEQSISGTLKAEDRADFLAHIDKTLDHLESSITNAEQVVGKIESLLGRSLSAEERTLIQSLAERG